MFFLDFILPGHPNVLEKSTSPPFRTTFEQIEQNDKFVLFFHCFLLNVHFLQIVDFLGSACCSCTHFTGQFNKLRYCAKTVHLFVHIFVFACFGRTHFTNMHKKRLRNSSAILRNSSAILRNSSAILKSGTIPFQGRCQSVHKYMKKMCYRSRWSGI